MPHNPSECPRCCWLAAREGTSPRTTAHETKDGLILVESPVSFCTSLDAVAGLVKEMNKYGTWCHTWILAIQQWRYYALPYGAAPCFGSPEDLPAACVIEAAMQVLGDKESDE